MRSKHLHAYSNTYLNTYLNTHTTMSSYSNTHVSFAQEFECPPFHASVISGHATLRKIGGSEMGVKDSSCSVGVIIASMLDLILYHMRQTCRIPCFLSPPILLTPHLTNAKGTTTASATAPTPSPGPTPHGSSSAGRWAICASQDK